MSESVQAAWVSRPVGGIPASDDLAPSTLFAVLYALLLPNIVYNFFFRKPRAGNLIQTSTVLFAVGRIAWCIIRAIQTAHLEKRTSRGLMKYVPATVGLGFIGVAMQSSSSAVSSFTPLFLNMAHQKIVALHGGVIGILLHFRTCFLASTVPGTVASCGYSSARFDQFKADKNLRLLNASASVVLAFQIITIIVSLLAAFKIREIDRMPVPIYRLCILRTINVFEPLSPSARAAFYIFHLVPEWLCVCVLLGTNVRARFRTGRWGDYELRESLRDKRLAKDVEDGVSLGRMDGPKAI
ncbi:hypothetical protein B0J17DRAFT_723441 [Rhizoctonia solani]|nr:hypothetical protein B0J17DRAFT_723441 [Rhizoctonia solani]